MTVALTPAAAELAHERPGVEVIAGRVDHLRVVRLDARDQRPELPVGDRVLVLLGDLDAELRRGLLEARRERLAEVVLQRQQDDPLLLEVVADELRAAATLHLADAGGTERKVARLGDVGMDRVGRDVRDPVLLEDRRRGARGARVTARHRNLHAVLPDQLVGDRHRLLGLALVVVHDELELAAVHAAGAVKLLDRELGAELGGLAVGRGGTGQAARGNRS